MSKNDTQAVTPVYDDTGEMIKMTLGGEVTWIPKDTGNQHYRDYLASLEAGA